MLYRLVSSSIHLGSREYAPHKCIRRQKPNRPCKQPIYQASQETVAEEQHARNESLDVQLCGIIPHAVHEDPEGAGSTDEEALPPPVVVFVAKLDVGRNYCDFTDRDDQYGAHNAQKAEDVVVAALVLPHALEDEHQLDEQYGERDQASQ